MNDSDLIAFTRKALVVLLIVVASALAWKLSYLLLLIFAAVVVAVVLPRWPSIFYGFDWAMGRR